MSFKNPTLLCSVALTLSGLLAGCAYEEPAGNVVVVEVAGSSTVYPVSARVAEAADSAIGVKATVASTGTGTGMERLANKECDITGASRPMKDAELENCEKNGVDPLSLKIGMDGLSVVVNPQNDWCDALTTAQLKKLWEHGSEVTTWKQLDDSWPDEKIKLFGPDDKSGTFDYFNEEIIGEVPEGQSPCREDYTPAVQDNVLVEGVKGDKYALGYFGYAYYVMNKESLKIVGVSNTDDAADAVKPSEATIEDGSYAPLSRPLFIYVNKEALKTKPEVAKFVNYYLNEGQEAVSAVGYVKVPEATLEAAKASVAEVTGK
ncbi:PstS family phosphate ABC transporter substrate-binding protein [Rubinisphaera sp.]|uniref:PstS family phosphate ABC transporter substrate-binding protein n=1 Tax=Rubinisphaera sp. TaxID=2024857 RepID=UPI000C115E7E|nr:PstS family phosphate ABC transporter substrate-binding protein [Rubinisphaera sp.]MBV07937.1 hypothetical protein [Rubinisphaera sp.]HCS53363.1 hypothetical protein [Planctomycetaceae bacterium]|tara:strand:- start:8657 stop:9613 length:957 start_codon:yes stop_codon:yes gene_type:complete